MTLILSNEEIDALLDMGELIDVLEDAYRELAEGRGGTRLRSDIITPTTLREDGLYALKSMDGVIPKLGVGAVRINSDILTFPQTGTGMRRVKVPAAPGNRYVGLVLLFSSHNGEPLAIMPDGVMQRARVGATNALAAKYLATRGRRHARRAGVGLAGRSAGHRARRGPRIDGNPRLQPQQGQPRGLRPRDVRDRSASTCAPATTARPPAGARAWSPARPTPTRPSFSGTGSSPACISGPSAPARPRSSAPPATGSTCSRCWITTTTRI